MARKFDVLLFGATGFTGRLCALYMARHAPASLAWGIAGRNQDKLLAIAKEVTALNPQWENKVGIVLADVSGSTAELNAATKQARVVLSTVGPFALYGEPLVSSCVTTGTDYIDSTGEAGWVAAMAKKYGAEAKAKSTTLVSLCGFDSIPADLGVLMLVKHAQEKLSCRLSEIKAYVAVKAGASGGTMASALNIFETKQNIFNPVMLVPTSPLLPAPKTLVEPIPVSYVPFYAADVKKWAYFFFMSPVNVNVVRKSAALHALPTALLTSDDGSNKSSSSTSLDRPADAYSVAPFRYSEFMSTSSIFTAIATTLALAAFAIIARVAFIRNILKRVVPQPGTGPSEAVRKTSFFQYTLVGTTEEAVPRKVVGIVAGGDPGYDETSKMLCESAMCLATQRDQITAKRFGYGFLTPATALGAPLIDRLSAANMRMQIIDSPAVSTTARM